MRNPRELLPIITIEARGKRETSSKEEAERGYEKSRFNSRVSVELLHAHDVDRCALPAPCDR